MSSPSKTLRAFASSRETQKEEATPALVPKLRFPEFRGTEGWKPSVLASACDMQAGKFVSASSISESNKEGLFPCYGGNGLRGYTATNTHDGTYPLIGRQGALCGNVRLATGQFHATEHAVVATPKNQIDVGWLYYSLDLLNLNRFATGQAQPGLSVDVLENVAVAIPPTPAEQQKIAECLSSLDELMAAQARKVDALKTHKKGLMQQLFPREGETQPRLRFPEFQNAGEWTEGKLISLSSEPLSNGVFNDPKKVGAGYKLINVSDMYIETTIDESRLSFLELSASDFRANQVMHGDIFFTRSSLVKSGIAVSNIYLGTSDAVTYDGHLIRFRPNTNKVVPLFAHYLFKTAPIRAHLIARGKSATMTTIGQADVASVTLYYPGKPEQHRIATCLSSLDARIAAETQKLAALKTHKQGLMQQLFPTVAGASSSNGSVTREQDAPATPA